LSARDYHAYDEEHYYKKSMYRRSDFYEEEGTRYRDRYDERDRYGQVPNNRFGAAASSAYYQQYRGRGRGRGRGASLYQPQYEDEYLSVHSSQKRTAVYKEDWIDNKKQTKYPGYADDDYYYDEQEERSKYDKKWMNVRQQGDDPREFEREPNFRYK
jgi:hypothetical protein